MNYEDPACDVHILYCNYTLRWNCTPFGMVAQRELVSGVGGSTVGLATRVMFLPVVGTRTEDIFCELSYIYQQGRPKFHLEETCSGQMTKTP